MKISSKEEALKHFMDVKQLEKVGLRAKVAFSTRHSSLGDYFVIEMLPRFYYVHSNGAIASEPPT